MSRDIKCPYCGAEQDINHDDGYGYSESDVYQQECGECEKTFNFRTSIVFYYDVEQCPCANGEDHKWVKTVVFPPEPFEKQYRCEYCQEKKFLSDDDISKL